MLRFTYQIFRPANCKETPQSPPKHGAVRLVTSASAMKDEPKEISNTVTHDMEPLECEYVQIPPLINQMARINLSFCKPDPETTSQWRPLNEGKTPAYGWVGGDGLWHAAVYSTANFDSVGRKASWHRQHGHRSHIHPARL